VTEFLSCRPNLEVDDLAPAAAFLREVLGFEVEVDEPEMGLLLLHRDAVGLALVRSATPGVNATTYIGVTGVDDLHARCAAGGARIVTGLADHPWGLRDFVVEIPGGHRLALGERISSPRLRRQGLEHGDFGRGTGHPAGLRHSSPPRSVRLVAARF
jgi:predicted enzyme related to lactoylglutathione lyase